MTTSISSPFCICSCVRPDYHFWRVAFDDALAVEEEADVLGVGDLVSWGYALALAVLVHQLLELRRALDLEENLLVVLVSPRPPATSPSGGSSPRPSSSCLPFCI
jgi:hypothetical protein